MRLQIIGNEGGSPSGGGCCSGYAVEEDGQVLLLECGPGVVASLQRTHALRDIAGVFISHMHGDHSLDLWTLAFRLTSKTWDGKRIPLFLPPGGTEILRKQAEVLIPNRFKEAFDVYECSSKESLEIGAFAVETMPMVHGVPCQGVRITAAETVLAFTGDTMIFPDLPGLASSADLFLCEASGRYPTDRAVVNGSHLTGAQAGQVAGEGKARRLILTHFTSEDLEYRQSLVTDASAEYSGPIEAAQQGAVYQIGATAAS